MDEQVLTPASDPSEAVYIAGPISTEYGGLSIEQRIERFHKAEDWLREREGWAVVLNPLNVLPLCGKEPAECRAGTRHIGQGGEDSHSWECYMRFDLMAVLMVKNILLLPGFQSSRGARLEHHIASELGYNKMHATFVDRGTELMAIVNGRNSK